MPDINFESVSYYTGVGSRKTPENIKTVMTALASKLELNWIHSKVWWR